MPEKKDKMKWKSTAEPVPGTYSINRITVDIREYLVTKKNSVPPFAWMRKCENIITITANSIVVDIESARWGKNSVPPFLWGGKKTYSYPQIVTRCFYTMPGLCFNGTLLTLGTLIPSRPDPA